MQRVELRAVPDVLPDPREVGEDVGTPEVCTNPQPGFTVEYLWPRLLLAFASVLYGAFALATKGFRGEALAFTHDMWTGLLELSTG
mgnify:CR=1 FL=1